MSAEISLRSLTDRPYELLKELERRSRAAASGQGPAAEGVREWVGVAFRLAGETFLAAREEVREVLNFPASITRIPGAKSWINGLANVRGQLLPVVDLKAFLGGAVTRRGRDTRILIVNHREIPAGLVVDAVLGFRRFVETERQDEQPQTVARCERYLQGSYRRGEADWPVISLSRLVEGQQFLHAAD